MRRRTIASRNIDKVNLRTRCTLVDRWFIVEGVFPIGYVVDYLHYFLASAENYFIYDNYLVNVGADVMLISRLRRYSRRTAIDSATLAPISS